MGRIPIFRRTCCRDYDGGRQRLNRTLAQQSPRRLVPPDVNNHGRERWPRAGWKTLEQAIEEALDAFPLSADSAVDALCDRIALQDPRENPARQLPGG